MDVMKMSRWMLCIRVTNFACVPEKKSPLMGLFWKGTAPLMSR